MKKTAFLFSVAFVLNIATLAAQKSVAIAGPPRLSAADMLMCNVDWHVISVEEWAIVTKPPGEKNKNDMLHLNANGTYTAILFGNSKSGSWTKSGQYINCVDEATKEKFSYKVISVEEKKLKLDYRDPDETHSIFEMEPK